MRPAPSAAATALAVALAIAGCARAPASSAESPPATAACGEIQRPPLQGGQHLIGDADPPDEYSSVPPTSGWHTSGAFRIEVRSVNDPLSEPEQVSVLEAGGVVAAYGDLPTDQRAAIESLAAQRYPGRLAVTPYEELPAGQVALTSWGVLQLCEGVDEEAIAAFVDAYAEQEPGVGHSR